MEKIMLSFIKKNKVYLIIENFRNYNCCLNDYNCFTKFKEELMKIK